MFTFQSINAPFSLLPLIYSRIPYLSLNISSPFFFPFPSVLATLDSFSLSEHHAFTDLANGFLELVLVELNVFAVLLDTDAAGFLERSSSHPGRGTGRTVWGKWHVGVDGPLPSVHTLGLDEAGDVRSPFGARASISSFPPSSRTVLVHGAGANVGQ